MKKKGSNNVTRARLDSEGEETETSTMTSVNHWMADHNREVHEVKQNCKEPWQDYKFHVVAGFDKALIRQVNEAIRILEAEEEGTVKVGKETWKVNKKLLKSKQAIPPEITNITRFCSRPYF